jgi:hypothetical protein
MAKTKLLTIRVTPDEMKLYQDKANKDRINLSVLIRDLLKTYEPKKES